MCGSDLRIIIIRTTLASIYFGECNLVVPVAVWQPVVVHLKSVGITRHSSRPNERGTLSMSSGGFSFSLFRLLYLTPSVLVYFVL